MGTALEAVEKKAEEGLDWMKVGIRSKVGAVRAGERRGATYLEDVEGEAWAVEQMIDELHRRYVGLMSISPYHPDPAEERRGRQLTIPGTGLDAAEPAEEQAPDAELKAATAELAVECDRLGISDAAVVRCEALRRPDGVLCIGVEGDDPTWGIEREAVRVLGAIRQLPDGAGDEAVRAILCGLAETAQADGEKTPDQIAESNIGFELERLDARSIAIEEVYPGDAGLMVRLRGPGMNFVVLRAGEAERELAELPNVTGAEATWQCLVNLDEGDQAELPAIERIHEALNRAGAPEIAIDSAGAAPGPEDVVVLRCAVEGRQHGERIGILTVEQILAVVEPIHAGAGSVAVWRALSWFADKVAKESRQGPPRRASAMGAVKRRGRKAADADAADVVVGGDSSEG